MGDCLDFHDLMRAAEEAEAYELNRTPARIFRDSVEDRYCPDVSVDDEFADNRWKPADRITDHKKNNTSQADTELMRGIIQAALASRVGRGNIVLEPSELNEDFTDESLPLKPLRSDTFHVQARRDGKESPTRRFVRDTRSPGRYSRSYRSVAADGDRRSGKDECVSKDVVMAIKRLAGVAVDPVSSDGDSCAEDPAVHSEPLPEASATPAVQAGIRAVSPSAQLSLRERTRICGERYVRELCESVRPQQKRQISNAIRRLPGSFASMWGLEDSDDEHAPHPSRIGKASFRDFLLSLEDDRRAPEYWDALAIEAVWRETKNGSGRGGSWIPEPPLPGDYEPTDERFLRSNRVVDEDHTDADPRDWPALKRRLLSECCDACLRYLESKCPDADPRCYDRLPPPFPGTFPPRSIDIPPGMAAVVRDHRLNSTAEQVPSWAYVLAAYASFAGFRATAAVAAVFPRTVYRVLDRLRCLRRAQYALAVLTMDFTARVDAAASEPCWPPCAIPADASVVPLDEDYVAIATTQNPYVDRPIARHRSRARPESIQIASYARYPGGYFCNAWRPPSRRDILLRPGANPNTKCPDDGLRWRDYAALFCRNLFYGVRRGFVLAPDNYCGQSGVSPVPTFGFYYPFPGDKMPPVLASTVAESKALLEAIARDGKPIKSTKQRSRRQNCPSRAFWTDQLCAAMNELCLPAAAASVEKRARSLYTAICQWRVAVETTAKKRFEAAARLSLLTINDEDVIVASPVGRSCSKSPSIKPACQNDEDWPLFPPLPLPDWGEAARLAPGPRHASTTASSAFTSSETVGHRSAAQLDLQSDLVSERPTTPPHTARTNSGTVASGNRRPLQSSTGSATKRGGEPGKTTGDEVSGASGGTDRGRSKNRRSRRKSVHEPGFVSFTESDASSPPSRSLSTSSTSSSSSSSSSSSTSSSSFSSSSVSSLSDKSPLSSGSRRPSSPPSQRKHKRKPECASDCVYSEHTVTLVPEADLGTGTKAAVGTARGGKASVPQRKRDDSQPGTSGLGERGRRRGRPPGTRLRRLQKPLNTADCIGCDDDSRSSNDHVSVKSNTSSWSRSESPSVPKPNSKAKHVLTKGNGTKGGGKGARPIDPEGKAGGKCAGGRRDRRLGERRDRGDSSEPDRVRRPDDVKLLIGKRGGCKEKARNDLNSGGEDSNDRKREKRVDNPRNERRMVGLSKGSDENDHREKKLRRPGRPPASKQTKGGVVDVDEKEGSVTAEKEGKKRTGRPTGRKAEKGTGHIASPSNQGKNAEGDPKHRLIEHPESGPIDPLPKKRVGRKPKKPASDPKMVSRNFSGNDDCDSVSASGVGSVTDSNTGQSPASGPVALDKSGDTATSNDRENPSDVTSRGESTRPPNSPASSTAPTHPVTSDDAAAANAEKETPNRPHNPESNAGDVPAAGREAEKGDSHGDASDCADDGNDDESHGGVSEYSDPNQKTGDVEETEKSDGPRDLSPRRSTGRVPGDGIGTPRNVSDAFQSSPIHAPAAAVPSSEPPDRRSSKDTEMDYPRQSARTSSPSESNRISFDDEGGDEDGNDDGAEIPPAVDADGNSSEKTPTSSVIVLDDGSSAESDTDNRRTESVDGRQPIVVLEKINTCLCHDNESDEEPDCTVCYDRSSAARPGTSYDVPDTVGDCVHPFQPESPHALSTPMRKPPTTPALDSGSRSRNRRGTSGKKRHRSPSSSSTTSSTSDPIVTRTDDDDSPERPRRRVLNRPKCKRRLTVLSETGSENIPTLPTSPTTGAPPRGEAVNPQMTEPNSDVITETGTSEEDDDADVEEMESRAPQRWRNEEDPFSDRMCRRNRHRVDDERCQSPPPNKVPFGPIGNYRDRITELDVLKTLAGSFERSDKPASVYVEEIGDPNKQSDRLVKLLFDESQDSSSWFHGVKMSDEEKRLDEHLQKALTNIRGGGGSYVTGSIHRPVPHVHHVMKSGNPAHAYPHLCGLVFMSRRYDKRQKTFLANVLKRVFTNTVFGGECAERCSKAGLIDAEDLSRQLELYVRRVCDDAANGVLNGQDYSPDDFLTDDQRRMALAGKIWSGFDMDQSESSIDGRVDATVLAAQKVIQSSIDCCGRGGPMKIAKAMGDAAGTRRSQASIPSGALKFLTRCLIDWCGMLELLAVLLSIGRLGGQTCSQRAARTCSGAARTASLVICSLSEAVGSDCSRARSRASARDLVDVLLKRKARSGCCKEALKRAARNFGPRSCNRPIAWPIFDADRQNDRSRPADTRSEDQNRERRCPQRKKRPRSEKLPAETPERVPVRVSLTGCDEDQLTTRIPTDDSRNPTRSDGEGSVDTETLHPPVIDESGYIDIDDDDGDDCASNTSTAAPPDDGCGTNKDNATVTVIEDDGREPHWESHPHSDEERIPLNWRWGNKRCVITKIPSGTPDPRGSFRRPLSGPFHTECRDASALDEYVDPDQVSQILQGIDMSDEWKQVFYHDPKAIEDAARNGNSILDRCGWSYQIRDPKDVCLVVLYKPTDEGEDLHWPGGRRPGQTPIWDPNKGGLSTVLAAFGQRPIDKNSPAWSGNWTGPPNVDRLNNMGVLFVNIDDAGVPGLVEYLCKMCDDNGTTTLCLNTVDDGDWPDNGPRIGGMMQYFYGEAKPTMFGSSCFPGNPEARRMIFTNRFTVGPVLFKEMENAWKNGNRHRRHHINWPGLCCLGNVTFTVKTRVGPQTNIPMSPEKYRDNFLTLLDHSKDMNSQVNLLGLGDPDFRDGVTSSHRACNRWGLGAPYRPVWITMGTSRSPPNPRDLPSSVRTTCKRCILPPDLTAPPVVLDPDGPAHLLIEKMKFMTQMSINWPPGDGPAHTTLEYTMDADGEIRERETIPPTPEARHYRLLGMGDGRGNSHSPSTKFSRCDESGNASRRRRDRHDTRLSPERTHLPGKRPRCTYDPYDRTRSSDSSPESVFCLTKEGDGLPKRRHRDLSSRRPKGQEKSLYSKDGRPIPHHHRPHHRRGFFEGSDSESGAEDIYGDQRRRRDRSSNRRRHSSTRYRLGGLGLDDDNRLGDDWNTKRRSRDTRHDFHFPGMNYPDRQWKDPRSLGYGSGRYSRNPAKCNRERRGSETYPRSGYDLGRGGSESGETSVSGSVCDIPQRTRCQFVAGYVGNIPVPKNGSAEPRKRHNPQRGQRWGYSLYIATGGDGRRHNTESFDSENEDTSCIPRMTSFPKLDKTSRHTVCDRRDSDGSFSFHDYDDKNKYLRGRPENDNMEPSQMTGGKRGVQDNSLGRRPRSDPSLSPPRRTLLPSSDSPPHNKSQLPHPSDRRSPSTDISRRPDEHTLGDNNDERDRRNLTTRGVVDYDSDTYSFSSSPPRWTEPSTATEKCSGTTNLKTTIYSDDKSESSVLDTGYRQHGDDNDATEDNHTSGERRSGQAVYFYSSDGGNDDEDDDDVDDENYEDDECVIPDDEGKEIGKRYKRDRDSSTDPESVATALEDGGRNFTEPGT